MSLDPSLLAQYRAAHYSVDVNGTRIELRVDQPSPALDVVLRARGVTRWALVTAHNPRSSPRSAAENAEAQARLLRALEEQQHEVLPALGGAADGSWSEESLVVLGIDEAAAQALMVEYAQNAFLVGVIGAPVRLVLTDV